MGETQLIKLYTVKYMYLRIPKFMHCLALKWQLDLGSRVGLKMSWGHSSVLHCASLLRLIFASLAHANERMHVHNARNFPQAKLDSERNVTFLFNANDDLYFLSHNNSVHVNNILFNFKKIKKFYQKEKKI